MGGHAVVVEADGSRWQPVWYANDEVRIEALMRIDSWDEGRKGMCLVKYLEGPDRRQHWVSNRNVSIR